jgi:alanine dehydrogenase
VPNTSTRALTNVTLPYAVALSDRGIAAAVEDPALAAGVNVAAGRVVQPEVAAAHGLPAVALRDVIGELPTPR